MKQEIKTRKRTPAHGKKQTHVDRKARQKRGYSKHKQEHKHNAL